jgi:hypothetical protein
MAGIKILLCKGMTISQNNGLSLVLCTQPGKAGETYDTAVCNKITNRIIPARRLSRKYNRPPAVLFSRRFGSMMIFVFMGDKDRQNRRVFPYRVLLNYLQDFPYLNTPGKLKKLEAVLYPGFTINAVDMCLHRFGRDKKLFSDAAVT